MAKKQDRMKAQHLAVHIANGPLPHLSKFALNEKITVVCATDEDDPHMVTTDIVYQSKKRTYVFCNKHNEYVDITLDEDEKE